MFLTAGCQLSVYQRRLDIGKNFRFYPAGPAGQQKDDSREKILGFLWLFQTEYGRKINRKKIPVYRLVHSGIRDGRGYNRNRLLRKIRYLRRNMLYFSICSAPVSYTHLTLPTTSRV